MRILVMLNPPNKRGTKKAYTDLRKFLLKDGYYLLQPEIFMRVEDSKKSCIKHENRIRLYIPKTGTVRMLILTEKQFCNSIIFEEKPNFQEEKVGSRDFILL